MISDNILKWYTDEIIRSKYNEVDKTDEIEEEKPKKRGRKPKNQNRDEE